MKKHIQVVSLLTPSDLVCMLAKARASPPGCFVEVGVYKGGSAAYLLQLAQHQQRDIYLYDTFTGMPYSDPTIDTIALGDVNCGNDTSEEAVRDLLGDYPYIEACVFPHAKLMPRSPIAFAHIDVDQYQSHVEACRALEPLMAPGGIMWFDDVPVLESARKAVRELYEGRIMVDTSSARWFVVFPVT